MVGVAIVGSASGWLSLELCAKTTCGCTAAVGVDPFNWDISRFKTGQVESTSNLQLPTSTNYQFLHTNTVAHHPPPVAQYGSC